MSIFSRAALLLALLSISTVARSDGIGFNMVSWIDGISFSGTPPAPQPTGDILMADGASLILQTDGASFICRAGGC